MANELCDILITVEPLDIPAPRLRADCGAVVEFLGVVRNREEDLSISGLTYEAFLPMAERQLQRIGEAAMKTFEINSVVLHHRVGYIPAAEPSLFVRVMAGHRGPAFNACQWVIERLKETVPIWKRAAS